MLGNQPRLFAALDGLDWRNTPVAAATVDTTRGRIETRTIRVLPVPDDLNFPGARQAVLIERYVTVKKKQGWDAHPSVFSVTSPPRGHQPCRPLACARGHGGEGCIGYAVIWKEDASLLVRNAPQVMPPSPTCHSAVHDTRSHQTARNPPHAQTPAVHSNRALSS